MIPCRMKSVRGWGDACIHNISSRGMMIASDDPLVPGDYVDIRRGRQVVIGRVIWRRDCYTGIRTQDVISADTLINEPRLEGRPVQSAAEADRRTSRSRAVSRIDTAHGLDRSRWLATCNSARSVPSGWSPPSLSPCRWRRCSPFPPAASPRRWR